MASPGWGLISQRMLVLAAYPTIDRVAIGLEVDVCDTNRITSHPDAAFALLFATGGYKEGCDDLPAFSYREKIWGVGCSCRWQQVGSPRKDLDTSDC